MGKTIHLAVAVIAASAAFATASSAIEYPLSFAPVGNYKDLVVAGYQIAGNVVIGNCSYTRITSGSGRDPRPSYTPIPQTCTWDLYGALQSVTAGAPAAPAPLYTDGTKTVYAKWSKRIYAGTDSALAMGGFVFKYGSHYDWLTSNAYLVLPQKPYTFTATITSNGDTALNVTGVNVSNALAGAKLTLVGTTCSGTLAVGGTCDVTVTYNDAKLSSPTGLAYDIFTIRLKSNAGLENDFVQRCTDEVKVPVDDGGS